MSAKFRNFLVVAAAGLIVLAAAAGPRIAGFAQSQVITGQQASGATVPYVGQLKDDLGGAVADGAYDFRFTLYSAETGGDAALERGAGRRPCEGGDVRPLARQRGPDPGWGSGEAQPVARDRSARAGRKRLFGPCPRQVLSLAGRAPLQAHPPKQPVPTTISAKHGTQLPTGLWRALRSTTTGPGRLSGW